MKDTMTLSELAAYMRVSTGGLRQRYLRKGLIKATVQGMVIKDRNGRNRFVRTYVVTKEDLNNFLKLYNQ